MWDHKGVLGGSKLDLGFSIILKKVSRLSEDKRRLQEWLTSFEFYVQRSLRRPFTKTFKMIFSMPARV